MSKFKPTSLMLALIAAGLCSPLVFADQDDIKNIEKSNNDQTDMEVIEVSGFKRSLIQAINQKRFSATVSEQ